MGSPARSSTNCRGSSCLTAAALPTSDSGVAPTACGHLLHEVVAFRMDGRVVQRLPAAADPQEPGALLKGLAPQPRHARAGPRGWRNAPWALRCWRIPSASFGPIPET